MHTCACGKLMAQIHPMTGAECCTHCDRPCSIRFCASCRALSSTSGRGPRTN